MRVTEAATAEYVFSSVSRAEKFGITLTVANPAAASDPYALVYARFDDGTLWATYPESTGSPRNYLHGLLEEFVAGGGIIQDVP